MEFNHSVTVSAYETLVRGYEYLKNEKFLDENGVINMTKYVNDLDKIKDHFMQYSYVSDELSTTMKRLVYYDICDKDTQTKDLSRTYETIDGKLITIRGTDDIKEAYLHRFDESDRKDKSTTNNIYINVVTDYAIRRGWNANIRNSLQNTFRSKRDEDEHFTNTSSIEKFLCTDAYIFNLSYEEVKIIHDSVFDKRSSSSFKAFLSYSLIKKYSLRRNEKDNEEKCLYYHLQQLLATKEIQQLSLDVDLIVRKGTRTLQMDVYKETYPAIRFEDTTGIYALVDMHHFENIVNNSNDKIVSIKEDIRLEINGLYEKYNDIIENSLIGKEFFDEVIDEYIEENIIDRIMLLDFCVSAKNNIFEENDTDVSFNTNLVKNMIKGNVQLNRKYVLELFYMFFISSNKDEEEYFLYDEEDIIYDKDRQITVPMMLANFITDANDLMRLFGYGEISPKRYTDMQMLMSLYTGRNELLNEVLKEIVKKDEDDEQIQQ